MQQNSQVSEKAGYLGVPFQQVPGVLDHQQHQPCLESTQVMVHLPVKCRHRVELES